MAGIIEILPPHALRSPRVGGPHLAGAIPDTLRSLLLGRRGRREVGLRAENPHTAFGQFLDDFAGITGAAWIEK